MARYHNNGRKITFIYKGKGDKKLLDNYRGISIGSNVGKLFSRIIQGRIEKFVEEKGLLGEIQNAFRRDRRGTDYILSQLIDMSKKGGKKLFLAFVDLRNAFDRVNRGVLWIKLMDIGFGGKLVVSDY